MIRQKDSGYQRSGRGAATHSQGNLIVEFQVESAGEDSGVGQDIEVGGEDEVVVEARTEIGVAAGGVDVELPCGGRVDGEVERHRETEGVKARAEVGGGRGKTEVKRLVLTCFRHAG